MAKKKAPKPEVPPVESATCTNETRVGGVHYFPGDTVRGTKEEIEALRESGDFD